MIWEHITLRNRMDRGQGPLACRIAALVALLFATALLPGCVILPAPAFVDEVELPEDPVEALGDEEAVVVLKPGSHATDESDFSDCIRKSLENAKPSIKVADLQTFRDRLFPWFEPGTYPSDPAKLREILSMPVVQDRAAEL
ncbi:MAG: hypothetical protein R3245_12550, partial [Kiloniellales bacterium]|nr:hypothetical protein [Kiloniellales bacterium]